MPQVSRHQLKPHVKQEIVSSLWWVFADLKTEKEIGLLVEDLLTQTEKTMLAKRLAIALMLTKGYSYEIIMITLKVSSSTVAHIRNGLDRGGSGYKLAIKKLMTHEKVEKFLKEIAKMTIRNVARNIRFS